MDKAHGQVPLSPHAVVIRDSSSHIACSLFLPARPRGVVIYGGLPRASSGFLSMILDALVDAELAVLAIPPQPRRQPGRLASTLQGARAWLAGQLWTAALSQGLLGCGRLAPAVLGLAGRREDSIKAVAVYEGDPQMAAVDLDAVKIPTLFVASAEHPAEAELNREMAWYFRWECKSVVLDEVLVPPKVVAEWFSDHFGSHDSGAGGGRSPGEGRLASGPLVSA